jgi:hypothetical protein
MSPTRVPDTTTPDTNPPVHHGANKGSSIGQDVKSAVKGIHGMVSAVSRNPSHARHLI